MREEIAPRGLRNVGEIKAGVRPFRSTLGTIRGIVPNRHPCGAWPHTMAEIRVATSGEPITFRTGGGMTRRRTGTITIEALLGLVVLLFLVVLVGGGLLYQRVNKLNTWAVATDNWLLNELYPWINDQIFQTGPENAGLPDGNKPPPPPDGL